MRSIRYRTLLTSAALLAIACRRQDAGATPETTLSGRWEGQVRLDQASQRVIVDIGDGDDNGVTLIIPELLRRDTTVRLERMNDSIRLSVIDGGGTLRFEGLFDTRTITLQTMPADAARPGEQPPPMQLFLIRRGEIPPDSVRFESHVVRNGDLALDATLALPVASGLHPAVVLLHGSGRGTRESLMHLARHFAENGIAALAYDKRPVVSFDGGDELTRSEDLAADAIAAVELLARHPSIRRDAIGVWGGSQGASVGAIASTRSPLVSFVVAVSGGGTAYTPFVVYQTTNRMQALGRPDADITLARDLVIARHEFLRTGGDSSRLAALLERGRGRMDGSRIPMNVPTTAEREAWARTSVLRAEAAASWRGVRVPSLVMLGSRDILVPPVESAKNIEAMLRANENRDYVVCVVEGADHVMLLPSGPGAGSGGSFAFPRLSRAYTRGMIEWVREQVGLARQRNAREELRVAGCVH